MSKVLMKGNEAFAEAAIRAGCKCYFGYPITPQNEIPEYMSHELPKAGGAFLQAESELAAVNAAYGAAASGGRVLSGLHLLGGGARGSAERQPRRSRRGRHSARPGRLHPGHPRRL